MYWNSEIELENGCWMSIYDLYTKIYEAEDMTQACTAEPVSKKKII